MSMELNTSLANAQATQAQFDNAAKTIKGAKSDAAIEQAAVDFEAMFIAEMMKPMFEGLEVDDTFGGGKGEEVFRGILLQEYGKEIAKTGQIGIADVVKAEMIKMQAGE